MFNDILVSMVIGLKLDIDPGLTCDDGLIGNIVVDKIIGIVTKEFELKINKLDDKNKTIDFYPADESYTEDKKRILSDITILKTQIKIGSFLFN